MKNRLFSLVNKKGQSFIITANSPEVALVKANRLGDQGWHIADELSVNEYCYKTLKRALSIEYDELTDELYHYFKASRCDRYLEVFIQADLIENLIGIREYDDIVKYVLENY
jgi:hypothetical protein